MPANLSPEYKNAEARLRAGLAAGAVYRDLVARAPSAGVGSVHPAGSAP